MMTTPVKPIGIVTKVKTCYRCIKSVRGGKKED